MEQFVYDQFNELENKHWWFCGRRAYLRKIIHDSFENKSSSLSFCEIGSGTGGNLSLLAEYSQVDSVEMNDQARKMIEEKSIKGVRNVYPGHLPDNMCHSDEYDGVFSLDVIEHIEDDAAALLEIKDYIKNDGLFISTVPAYQWLWSAHDVANFHHRRYTKTTYCELIDRAGYDIIYSSYFNTLLFPLAAISRLVEKLIKRDTDSDAAALTMPNKLINSILFKIFSIESWWAGKVSIPFGLSVVVVAKKK